MAINNQDIMTLESEIKEKAAKYTGKDDILGITLMTFVQYISSTRSTMFTNHMKQYNVLNNPEFPKVFTGYEDIFGKMSSGIVKANTMYKVVDKVEKFADKPGHLYLLFIYDPKNDFYDVIQKKYSEELTENFGYKYNNEVLDSLKVGSTIKKGLTLYKSTSYDEDDNYRFGLNARVAVMLAPGVIEDAYVVRRGFAKRMVSIKNDRISISINDNDFLLNIYGNSSVYKGFPDIGEEVKGRIPAAKRRIINDQCMYDMKKANMMRIQPMSDKPYWTMGGTVVDIDIYSNKEISEIPDTQYNAQILYYLKNQNRYCKEVVEVCEKIMDTGSKYSDDIGFIYSRCKHIIDPNWKWKDSDRAFSNMQIELHVVRDNPLAIGSKIVGRYGDKGVISELRDDDKMPMDENGRPVDVVVNPLACPNRLNPFQWVEMSFTHQAEKIVEMCKKLKTNDKRWDLLNSFLEHFNDRGERDQLDEYYHKLSKKDQDEFWKMVFEDGIYMQCPPMWQKEAAIDKIDKINKQFGIGRDQLYINKWGRKIPIMNTMVVGYKYMLKLKHTSEKNFSARATGYLSQKGIPEKSNKVKTNEMLYSTTPVAIGRDENNNLGIGVKPFILAKMHLFYRTSPFARKKIGKLYTNDPLNFKKFKIKKGFTNRNVEILNAKFKSLGIKIDFGFDGVKLDIEDGMLHTYHWRGETYVCSRNEMRQILIEDLMRSNFKRTGIKKSDPDYEKKYQDFKEKHLGKLYGNLVLDIE